jgi:hypothetical protein
MLKELLTILSEGADKKIICPNGRFKIAIDILICCNI